MKIINTFNYFLSKFSQNNNNDEPDLKRREPIDGNGIQKLKNTFENMIVRGKPDVLNDFGFNKPDWVAATEIYSLPEYNSGVGGLPIEIINAILNLLSHYQNTQIKEFHSIKRDVILDVEKYNEKNATQKPQKNRQEGKYLVIKYDHPKFTGKILVEIGGGWNGYLTRKKNALIREYIDQSKKDIKINDLFSLDSENIDHVRVHHAIIDRFKDMMRSIGYEVIEIGDREKEITDEEKWEDVVYGYPVDVINDNEQFRGKTMIRISLKAKQRHNIATWRQIRNKGLSNTVAFYRHHENSNILLDPLSGRIDELIKTLEDNGYNAYKLKHKINLIIEREKKGRRDFHGDGDGGFEGELYIDPTNIGLPIHIIERNYIHYGKRTIKFELGGTYNNRIDAWKQLAQNGLANTRNNPGVGAVIYEPNSKTILLNLNTANENVQKVFDVLKRNGYSTRKLEDTLKSVINEGVEEGKINEQEKIEFTDSISNNLVVKFIYGSLSERERLDLPKAIQYIFPNYKWQSQDRTYSVSGSFKQFKMLENILKQFKIKTDSLSEIIERKVKNGHLEKTRWEGEARVEDLQNKLEEKLSNSKYEFYDAQKIGIEFLVNRDSAILGDETGAGKTVQLVSAAEIRFQQTKKPVLVVGLKGTVDQWENTIKDVVGENESITKIDNTNFENFPRAKWVLAYYDNFSHRNDQKAQSLVNRIKGMDFCCVIFDEIHKLKKVTSKRSQRLEEATRDIQTKWGASATISANKPFDVKNQLLIIGHPMGKISNGKFKREMSGMVLSETPFGQKVYVEGSFENQIKAAENLNRWMNLSGLYIRRNKSDIKENMANLEVDSEVVDTDKYEFNNRLREKIIEYKDPNLKISQLIAAREVVAIQKTSKTTEEVRRIIVNNMDKENPAASKVVVFTNSIEAGRQLERKIRLALQEINPKFSIVTYNSDTSKKELQTVKSRFINNNDIKVLLMSLKMGGTGIDFPNAAQHMVINDFDWTPESADQSEGRTYRVSTNHDVYIKYIISDGIDQELYEKVQRKRELAKKIQIWREEYYNTGSRIALEEIVKLRKEHKAEEESMDNLIDDAIKGAISGEEGKKAHSKKLVKYCMSNSWYKNLKLSQTQNELLEMYNKPISGGISITGTGQSETIYLHNGLSINSGDILRKSLSKIQTILTNNGVHEIDTSPIYSNPNAQGLAISHEPGKIHIDIKKIIDKIKNSLPPISQLDGIGVDKDISTNMVNEISKYMLAEIGETLAHESQHVLDYNRVMQQGQDFSTVQEYPAEQFGQHIRQQHFM